MNNIITFLIKINSQAYCFIYNNTIYRYKMYRYNREQKIRKECEEILKRIEKLFEEKFGKPL